MIFLAMKRKAPVDRMTIALRAAAMTVEEIMRVPMSAGSDATAETEKTDVDLKEAQHLTVEDMKVLEENGLRKVAVATSLVRSQIVGEIVQLSRKDVKVQINEIRDEIVDLMKIVERIGDLRKVTMKRNTIGESRT